MKVKNRLNFLILEEKMIALDNGEKKKIREIEAAIADYCGVSRDLVVSIKSGKCLPSLKVAILISEYFNTNVNNIFQIERK